MTPETPSSSGSDNSKATQRSGEEKLVVTVRIRPVRPDESVRILHAEDKKVKNERIIPLVNIGFV